MAFLVDVEDLKRPTARVVCRELLASCVFRPLLGWAAPYYFNKALYSFLGEPQVRGMGPGHYGGFHCLASSMLAVGCSGPHGGAAGQQLKKCRAGVGAGCLAAVFGLMHVAQLVE